MFEMSFWMPKEWNNWANENFFKLMKAWINQDKDKIIQAITFNNSLDNIKQNKGTQIKTIELLESLKKFIKVFKDNPAELSLVFEWWLDEVKAVNIDTNAIDKTIDEVIQEIKK